MSLPWRHEYGLSLNAVLTEHPACSILTQMKTDILRTTRQFPLRKGDPWMLRSVGIARHCDEQSISRSISTPNEVSTVMVGVRCYGDDGEYSR